jgi:hypothetical protein
MMLCALAAALATAKSAFTSLISPSWIAEAPNALWAAAAPIGSELSWLIIQTLVQSTGSANAETAKPRPSADASTTALAKNRMLNLSKPATDMLAARINRSLSRSHFSAVRTGRYAATDA